jgi:hypothetical protein
VSRSPKASTRATPKPAPFDRAGSPGCGPSSRTSRPGRRPWHTFCATPWAGRARAEGAHHRDAAHVGERMRHHGGGRATAEPRVTRRTRVLSDIAG